jgi:hypothetical protein
MIAIDFQGGAHGNFLEFVCNTMAGLTQLHTDPFNKLGASHNKNYMSNPLFVCNHYTFNRVPFPSNKIISIQIAPEDLLPLSQISLLRAGDYNYDNNQLEINTYHKLNNSNYRWVLDTIIESFFKNQIKCSYDAVRDPSWPDVETVEDFEALPDRIKHECVHLHQLTLLKLEPDQPNCPRSVLREFFQIGFENPVQHGFMYQQTKMIYDSSADVFVFPFNAFYSQHKFLQTLKDIAQWAKLSYPQWDRITELHQKFMDRQPYWNSKLHCDQLVQLMLVDQTLHPEINLLEEAYVNAMLKKHGHECRY